MINKCHNAVVHAVEDDRDYRGVGSRKANKDRKARATRAERRLSKAILAECKED